MLSILYLTAVLCQTVSASPVVSYFPASESSLEIRTPEDPVYEPHQFKHNVLMPRHHPEHDAEDHAHLCPEMTKELFFGQHRHQNWVLAHDNYAHVQTTFQLPAVVLDHSSHIERTSVQDGAVNVIFNNVDAFDTAAYRWSGTGIPFMLITAADSHDGHLQYLTVSSLECTRSIMKCTMNATITQFEHCIDEFDMEIGTYNDLMNKREENDRRAEAPWTQGQSDLALDAELGYYDFNEGSFAQSMASFMEGLDNPTWAELTIDENIDDGGLFDENGLLATGPVLEVDTTDDVLRRRLLDSLGNKVLGKVVGFTNGAKDVTEKVQKGLESAADGTKKFIKEKLDEFSDKAKEWAKQGIEGMQNFKSYFDGTPKEWNWNPNQRTLPENKEKIVDDHPFEDENGKKYVARLLWDSKSESEWKSKPGRKAKGTLVRTGSLKLLCLDCGVTANYKMKGSFAFKLTEGVKKATLYVDGNIQASLRLGLVGEVKVGAGSDNTLFSAGLPLLSVPNFVTVGPMISMDLNAEIELELKGHAMAGVSVKIEAQHEIDFKNLKGGKSFKPKTSAKAQFEAAGEATLSAKLVLPISLSFGLNILNKKFASAQANLVSEPALQAEAKLGASYKAGTSTTSGSSTEASYGSPDCKGIDASLRGLHVLYLDAEANFLKWGDKTGRYNIPGTSVNEPIWSKCITFKKKKGKRESLNSTIDDGFEAAVLAEPFKPLVATSDTVATQTWFGDTRVDTPPEIAAFMDPNGPSFASPLHTDPNIPDQTLFNYTVIDTIDGSFSLIGGEAGNLGIQPSEEVIGAENLFANWDGVVVGDALGRFLAYFSQEMEAFGVSRIRLENPERIPKTSRLVTLVPVTVPGLNVQGIPPAVLMAVDSKFRMFIPVICTYKDSTPSKIFIVDHLEDGIKKLKDSSTDKKVTVGAVDDCIYIGLSNGLPGIV